MLCSHLVFSPPVRFLVRRRLLPRAHHHAMAVHAVRSQRNGRSCRCLSSKIRMPQVSPMGLQPVQVVCRPQLVVLVPFERRLWWCFVVPTGQKEGYPKSSLSHFLVSSVLLTSRLLSSVAPKSPTLPSLAATPPTWGRFTAATLEGVGNMIIRMSSWVLTKHTAFFTSTYPHPTYGVGSSCRASGSVARSTYY